MNKVVLHVVHVLVFSLVSAPQAATPFEMLIRKPPLVCHPECFSLAQREGVFMPIIIVVVVVAIDHRSEGRDHVLGCPETRT